MTHVETVLLGYLNRHCRGAARARKCWKIAEDLTALGVKNATERGVRDALASLRMACIPVGTTSGDPPGAFLCEDRRDFRRAYRHLYGRLKTQARGCRRFRRCFTERMNGQLRLDFPEAQAAYDALHDAPLLAGLEVEP
jgi:hypothetical protein